jgi:hypothetical protein
MQVEFQVPVKGVEDRDNAWAQPVLGKYQGCYCPAARAGNALFQGERAHHAGASTKFRISDTSTC